MPVTAADVTRLELSDAMKAQLCHVTDYFLTAERRYVISERPRRTLRALQSRELVMSRGSYILTSLGLEVRDWLVANEGWEKGVRP